LDASKKELEAPFDLLLQRLSAYVPGIQTALSEVVPA